MDFIHHAALHLIRQSIPRLTASPKLVKRACSAYKLFPRYGTIKLRMIMQKNLFRGRFKGKAQ